MTPSHECLNEINVIQINCPLPKYGSCLYACSRYDTGVVHYVHFSTQVNKFIILINIWWLKEACMKCKRRRASKRVRDSFGTNERNPDDFEDFWCIEIWNTVNIREQRHPATSSNKILFTTF